jgi:hypothetical protein
MGGEAGVEPENANSKIANTEQRAALKNQDAATNDRLTRYVHGNQV